MKEKKPFIINFTISAIFLIIGLVIQKEYYSTLFFSMGIGIMFSSIIQLVHISYYKRPEHRKEYEEKKQKIHINNTDERKIFLRDRAGHITYQIMTFILLGLSFLLSLLHVNPWVILMTFTLFLLQYLIGILVFYILEKRF